jgi:hypothetical protein
VSAGTRLRLHERVTNAPQLSSRWTRRRLRLAFRPGPTHRMPALSAQLSRAFPGRTPGPGSRPSRRQSGLSVRMRRLLARGDSGDQRLPVSAARRGSRAARRAHRPQEQQVRTCDEPRDEHPATAPPRQVTPKVCGTTPPHPAPPFGSEWRSAASQNCDSAPTVRPGRPSGPECRRSGSNKPRVASPSRFHRWLGNRSRAVRLPSVPNRLSNVAFPLPNALAAWSR